MSRNGNLKSLRLGITNFWDVTVSALFELDLLSLQYYLSQWVIGFCNSRKFGLIFCDLRFINGTVFIDLIIVHKLFLKKKKLKFYPFFSKLFFIKCKQINDFIVSFLHYYNLRFKAYFVLFINLHKYLNLVLRMHFISFQLVKILFVFLYKIKYKMKLYFYLKKRLYGQFARYMKKLQYKFFQLNYFSHLRYGGIKKFYSKWYLFRLINRPQRAIALYEFLKKKVRRRTSHRKNTARFRNKLKKFYRMFFSFFNLLKISNAKLSAGRYFLDKLTFAIIGKMHFLFLQYFLSQMICRMLKFRYVVDLSITDYRSTHSYILLKANFFMLLKSSRFLIHRQYSRKSFVFSFLAVQTSFFLQNPRIFVQFFAQCLQRTHRHSSVCYRFFDIINYIRKFYPLFNSVRLEICGTFDNQDRKKRLIFQTIDHLHAHQISMPIEYYFFDAITKVGAFGIKCWISYKEYELTELLDFYALSKKNKI